MQNPEIQLCNKKMKCAAKTSYARNYDHPECSTLNTIQQHIIYKKEHS